MKKNILTSKKIIVKFKKINFIKSRTYPTIDMSPNDLEYSVLLSNHTSLLGERNHNIFATSLPVVSSSALSNTCVVK